MASQHSLGPVARWFQKRMGTLYESAPPPEQADFKALFYSTFSENAKIYLNHEPVSQEGFLAGLDRTNTAIASATVDWKEIMDVAPKEGAESNEVGIVAGFFVVTRSMKFRIRVGHAQRLSYNTFSAKIEQTADNAGIGPDESRFRVSQLFITTAEKAAPIHLYGMPAPFQTVEPHEVEKS